jgi:integrase
MLSERDLGRNIDSTKQTLNQYLDRWLEVCARPRLRAKSFQDYEGLLRRYIRPQLEPNRWPRFRRLTSKASIASCWIEACRHGPSATHTVLRSALKQAVRWKLLLANPAQLVDLPRQTRRDVGVLNVEQARAFIPVIAGHPYETLFALAMMTGMRPSEYLAPTWADIDLVQGTVRVSRTLEWARADGILTTRSEHEAGARLSFSRGSSTCWSSGGRGQPRKMLLVPTGILSLSPSAGGRFANHGSCRRRTQVKPGREASRTSSW